MPCPLPPSSAGPAPLAPAAPQIDVVVPVLDEEATLERSVRRLHRYLSSEFPFTWRIVIADNASTDATPAIAARLHDELPGVDAPAARPQGPRPRAARRLVGEPGPRRLLHGRRPLDRPARAAAARRAAALAGTPTSRSARASRTARASSAAPRRELISRGYNRILHAALRARFSDAQCGFKAVRRDVLDPLLADVRDDGWFFDTELLVLAQRRGLRIHEVPVDWVDDPDSRVDVVRTAIDDLKGVARLRARLADRALHVRRRRLHARLRAALPRCCAARSAPASRTRWRWRSPRSATPPRTAGCTFGLRGRARAAPPARARRGRLRADARPHHGRARRAARDRRAARARASSSPCSSSASTAATITRYVALRSWVFARRRRAELAAAT